MSIKYLTIFKSTLLAGAGAALLTGCVRERVVYRTPPPQPATVVATAPDEVVVSDVPPPAVAETVVVAPGPGYFWVRGEWVWRGNWVWVPGRWAYPPRAGAHWRGGRVVVRHGARVYVRGGWVF